jgi:hypothetical protein
MGDLMPFRCGDMWEIQIELATGLVIGWPRHVKAEIHYKVCDNGKYWLENENGERVKYKRDYVPDGLLCMGDSGYGDYIILRINEDGYIADWKPEINSDEWEKA